MQIKPGDTVQAITDYETLPQFPAMSPRMTKGDTFEVVEVGDGGHAIGVKLTSPHSSSTLQYVPVSAVAKVTS